MVAFLSAKNPTRVSWKEKQKKVSVLSSNATRKFSRRKHVRLAGFKFPRFLYSVVRSQS